MEWRVSVLGGGLAADENGFQGVCDATKAGVSRGLLWWLGVQCPRPGQKGDFSQDSVESTRTGKLHLHASASSWTPLVTEAPVRVEQQSVRAAAAAGRPRQRRLPIR